MRYVVRTVAWLEERRRNVDVLCESIPHLERVVDHVGDGYANFFAACRLLHDTGGVLLEDDVLLCRRFTERLESIVAEKGVGEVISFFERPKVNLDTRYMGGASFFWAQCVYFPPGLMCEFEHNYAEFRQNRPKQWQGMATDRLIAYTLSKLGRKYWRIRPTLVQHLPFTSAIGGRSTKRQTPYFIDDLEDARDLQPV